MIIKLLKKRVNANLCASILLLTGFTLFSIEGNSQGCIPPSVISNSIGQTQATICTFGGGSVVLKIPNFTSNTVIWYYSPALLGPYSQVPGKYTETETFNNAGYYKYYQTTSACGNFQSPSIHIEGVTSVPLAPTLSVASNIICDGIPVILNGTANDGITAGFNFYSSPSATPAPVAVTTPGDYYATAINVCGKSPSSNIVTLTAGTTPSKPTITLPSLPLCNGAAGTLTASGDVANTYTWYFNGSVIAGQTGQTVSVADAGDYTVEETNACGTSTRSDAVTVTVLSTPAKPVITSPTAQLCSPSTVVLTANGAGGIYTWSTGETGATITVGTGGNYTVNETNGCGTSPNSDPKTITVSTLPGAPTVNASGSLILCDGAGVTLSATPATVGGVIYWSTGASGNSITVSTAGTYYAYETNSICGTGPNSSNVVVTTANTPTAPTVTAASTLVCNGAPITLNSTGSNTITWYFNGSSTGVTGSAYAVNAAGSYSTKETNLCGTSGFSNSIVVTTGSTPSAPSISSSAGTLLCNGASTTLSTSPSSGGTITWSDGFNAWSGNSITVTAAGSYYAYETNSCGSSGISNVITISTGSRPAAPIISSSAGTLLCNGASTTLSTSPSAGGFINFSDGISGWNTNSLVVTTGGSYYAVEVNSCGQSAVSNIIAISTGSTPAVPTISSSAGTLLCNGASTTLTASGSSGSITWYNASSTLVGSGTTYSTNVAGNYFARSTTSCGVAETSWFVLTANNTPSAPTISSSAGTLLCNGASTTLSTTPSAGGTITWSDGINAWSGNSITVTAAGSYYAFETNSCGSSGISNVIAISTGSRPAAPVISSSAGTLLCNGASTTLSTSPTAGGIINFSDGISGWNTNSLVVTTGGSYYAVEVNSCGQSAVSNIINISTGSTPAVPTISSSAGTLLCNGASTTLTANGSTGSITWYNASSTLIGSGTTYTTNAAGIYFARSTNSCGVAETGWFILSSNNTPSAPIISSSAGTLLCNGASTTLSTSPSAGGTITWSTGATGNSITVSAAGTYYAYEVNSCGTSANSNSIVITTGATPAAPTVSTSASTLLCNGASTTLSTSPSAGGTITWSTGATGNSIIVSAAGTYYAYEVNTCGTSANSNSIVISTGATPAAPSAPSITAGSNLLCDGVSTTITASGGSGTYQWSTGATGNSITVSTAGSYFAYSPGITNSCGTSANSSNSNTVVISTGSTPSAPTVSSSAGTLLCNGASTTLSTSSNAGDVIHWSTGATGNSISVSTAGTYYAYEVNSCGTSANSNSIVITTGSTPSAPNVSSSAGTLLCNGAATTLSTSPSAGGVIHWSTGATGNSITVSIAGTYYAYEVNSCGTSANSNGIVVTTGNNPFAPTVNNGGASLLCNGASTTLSTSPNAGGVIHWSTGATGNSITVSTAGTYYAYEVNSCGTSANSNSIVITTNVTPPAPTISSSNGTLLCNGAATTLSTSPSAGGTITWSTGATGNSIIVSAAGTYYAYETNACAQGTNSNSIVITTSPIAPTVNSESNQIVCNSNNTTAVTFTGPLAGSTYAWTNNTPSIGLAASGSTTVPVFTAVNNSSAPVIATITVTPENAGCYGVSKSYTITVNPTPTVNAVTNQTLCNGSATSAIAFSSLVASTTFNWTNSNSSIGLPATGSGDIASFTALNNSGSVQTATVTVTPVANGCPGTPSVFTISVKPTPSVNSISNQTLCNGSTTNAIIFTGAVAGTTHSWINNTPSIGLAASGTGNIGSFSAVNNTSAPVTATITVNTSANGCSGGSTSFSITVNPTPTVNVVSNQILCNGTSTAAIAFSGAVAGTTYSWSNNNTNIGLAASGTGDINSFTAVNNGSSPITATITVNTSANGCPGGATSFTITVNPTPSVNTVSNQTLCNGSTTNAIIFTGAVAGTTYSWTNNSPTIGLAASGTGNIGSFTAINNTSAPITATITVNTSANGCPGSSTTFTITVNPTPAVNTASNQTLCNGGATNAVAFSGAVTGTIYSWTNNNTNIGLAASGTGDISSFTAINNGTTPITATITVITSANGCTGGSTSFTITVNPTPTVNAVSNQTLCNGATTNVVAFSGGVAGTTFSWTNNTPSIGLAASGTGNIGSFSAINNTSAPITATITINTSANGCPGTSTTFTITVNPTPTVNTVSNQTLCNSGTTAAIAFSGAVAGTTYTWTNNNTNIGLAASGTGNIGSFTAVNNSNAPITATITVNTSANGCPGGSTTFTITVNPTPTVNAVSNQTLCNGATTNAVAFSGGVAGTTFSWMNNTPSIGLSASGSGNIGSFTAINNTSAPITATITVNTSANGCPGASTTFTITVNPTPTVNTVSNQTLCNGALTNAVAFIGSVAGTTYSWTNSNTNIGLAASGSGNIGSFTAVNNTNAPITATITVSTSANGCPGGTTTFTITVNPTPIVNAITNQTLCNGSATNAIAFSGAVAGTTYNWTNNNTNIGLAASGTGNINSFTAVNNTNAPITATITVTPVANGCPGASTSFTITVNPTPTVNVVSSQTLCNGVATNAVSFSGAVAGTTYSWSNNNTNIGLAASGSGNIASFTAINNTNAPITATITVNTSANGCSGGSTSFTITVNPTPTVNTVSNQTLCNGATTNAVAFRGGVAGTTFSWTNNNTAIGLAASGTGDINSFTAVNNGSSPITATITVNTLANGCPGTSITFSIIVNPTPTVNTVSNQILCNGSTTNAVTFTGAVAGTTFNWTNSNTTIGLAASGTGNISSFTGLNNTNVPITANIIITPVSNSCIGVSTSFSITVNPTPTVNTVTSQVLCNGFSTTAISFTGSVSGTSYTWVNNNTTIGLAGSGTGDIGSFTAVNNTNAPTTATITVNTSANGCPGASTTFTITVNPTPTVNTVSNQTLCNGATTNAVTFTGAVAGTTYSWSNNTPSIGLAASGTGNIGSFTAINNTNVPITAFITITPSANGCTGVTSSFSITVNPTPTVNTVTSQVLCNGFSSTAISFGGTVSGTTYNWTNSNTTIGLAGSGTGDIGSFTALNNTNAPVTATITVNTSANGCPGTSTTFTITVNPTPTVNTISSQVLCNGFSTTAVSFNGGVSGTTYSWVNNSPSIGLAASGTGDISSFTAINNTNAPITATITVNTSATGCSGASTSFSITVNPTPTVNTVANQVYCINAIASVVFSGSVSGTSYNWTNSNTTIGLAGSGTGNISSFTTLNTNSYTVTSNLTVTPIANGCVGALKNFTITVNPFPTVSSVSNQVVCNGFSTTGVVFSSTVSGTTYSWNCDNTSIGIGAFGAGNFPSFTAINNTSAPITATITVNTSANGCPGAFTSFTITVNPTPTVNSVTNVVVCNGFSTTDIAFTGSVSGTNYYWTNSNTTIGLAGSGNGDIPSFTALNITSAPVIATITVTTSANGCSGGSTSFTITVNPTPVLSSVLIAPSICDSATFTYVPSSAVTGATFTWSRAAVAGIANPASNGTGIITEVLSNTTNADVTVSYLITITANGCTNAQTVTVVVHPTPYLTYISPPPITPPDILWYLNKKAANSRSAAFNNLLFTQTV